MDYLQELETLGVDVKEGLGRVMDDEDLYKMMLGMFLTAIESTPITPEEFDAPDLDGLIAKIHSLKGTTGNLSMNPIFHPYTKALALLREGKPAEAKKVFLSLLPAQEQLIACIKRHQG